MNAVFRSFLLRTLSVLTLVTACGPTGPTVDVKLLTGLESQGRFKNLMNGLVSNPNSIGTCTQKNVYAVVAVGDGPEAPLETFRVPVVTAMDTSLTFANPIDALWVTQNSTFPPIVVPAPRGTEVGVGIVGALSWSMRPDSSGTTCNDFVAGAGATTPYTTSSIIGHRRITATASMEVPLKVWVNPVTAAPQATPSGGVGDPACDQEDPGQFCPSQDFFQLNCPGCTGVRHIQLEYAYDRVHPEQRVIQWIPYTQAGGILNIPNILPMTINLVMPATNSVSEQVRFAKADFAPGGNGNSVANKTVGVFGITLTERAKRIPPVIGSFSITSLQQQGDNVLVYWTTPANATRYQLMRQGAYYTDVTPPAPGGSSVIPGLPGINSTGGSHALQIIASNTLGSTSVITASVSIDAIGPFSTAPVRSASGTANTLPINCGTALNPGAGAIYSVSGTYISGGGGTPATGGTNPPTLSGICTSGSLMFTTTGLTTGAQYNLWVHVSNPTGGARDSTPFTATVF